MARRRAAIIPSTSAVTPGTTTGASAGGMFSNPQTVGDLIKKQYPGYYDNIDSVTLGQGWIANHAPAASAGGGAGVGGDTLTAPTSGSGGQSQQRLQPGNPYEHKINPQPQKQNISLTQGMSMLNPNVTSIAQATVPGYQVGQDNTLYSAPQIPQSKPDYPDVSNFDITKAGY